MRRKTGSTPPHFERNQVDEVLTREGDSVLPVDVLAGMGDETLLAYLLAADDAAFKQIASEIASAGWRILVERRTTRISAAVRAAERALGDRFAHRDHAESGRWNIWGGDTSGNIGRVVVIVAPSLCAWKRCSTTFVARKASETTC